MKKIVLSMVAVLAFGFANAQESTGSKGFSKGDVFISGSVGIASEKTGDEKTSGFTIEPKVGFFVTENIAIGGKLGFGSLKAENGGGDTEDLATLTVGAFGRYYFTPASDFSLFGELGVDYSSIDDKLDDFKANEIGANLGLGLSYFVSSNFAIEATWAGLGYTTNDNGGDGAEKTNSFGLNADLSSINFGLLYKF
ncbi:outer membrane beta-barrel protein [Flavobacterium hydrophilum]|uniref:Porin family protein n=1 Tax=Flavobacterium hydrophilum TaxID=2211445 RepID=A0A2V4BZS0_9FLAO|nr:outer membrane beta-barrel protein [Flavobacterium hydrophilum]PXY44217.1 porin family protein [Flavobacterium hydrophilum]